MPQLFRTVFSRDFQQIPGGLFDAIMVARREAQTATIEGDLLDVKTIITRSAIVFGQDTPAGTVWAALEQIMDDADDSSPNTELLAAVRIAFWMMKYPFGHPHGRGIELSMAELEAAWQSIVDIIQTLPLDTHAYPRLVDLLDQRNTFNASQYWRNWDAGYN